MPTPKGPVSHSLASSLKPFLHLRRAELSLGAMLGRIESGNGPGPVVFILTLPILLPLPPGVSMVLALPLLLVAPQIVIGRRKIWLPKALLGRTIKRPLLIKLIKRILPSLERAERVVRPRLGFLTGRAGASMVGVACALLAVVLVLPIPFANLVPALALAAFSIGLTRKDGLFVLVGYGLIAVATGVVILGIHGFSLGLRDLLRLL